MTWIEENCTIEFEGKTFESGGAIISPDFVIAYPAEDGVLTDWHGNKIGSWKSVASWVLPRSQWGIGSRMYQIEATVNGVTYTGRGFGVGMLYRGKRKAKQ